MAATSPAPIIQGVEMENSQDRRPNEVALVGSRNINYSRPNELTQDVEIPGPRAVRVVRSVRVGLPATAMAILAQSVAWQLGIEVRIEYLDPI
jgi:hypothetical protein